MRFSPRKDIFFRVLFMSTGLVLLVTSLLVHTKSSGSGLGVIIHLTNLIVVGFLFWIYFGTHYSIDEKRISYQSAFLSGSIPISSIRKIEVGVTQWAGMRKFGLARGGVIITYHKYDDIYFTPESNDEFVACLLKLNPEIEIIKKA